MARDMVPLGFWRVVRGDTILIMPSVWHRDEETYLVFEYQQLAKKGIKAIR